MNQLGSNSIETPRGGSTAAHPLLAHLCSRSCFGRRSGRSWLSWHCGHKSQKNRSRTRPNRASAPQKSGLGLPKSSLEPPKTLFFKGLWFKSAQHVPVQNFCGAKMANLARTWRPKTLPNRGRNPKKSMLKNSTFLASILEGFGPRFGRVFERFFGPKTYAKSEHLISVKS